MPKDQFADHKRRDFLRVAANSTALLPPALFSR